MNVDLTSMLWGGLSGAAMFALGLYWLWDMKPSNAETEWLRSELKDLRSDLNAECAKRQRVEDRVLAIEKPPFEPKFGDWVSTTYRGDTVKAIYLVKIRGGQHRVIANIDGATTEFYADEVEPLND